MVNAILTDGVTTVMMLMVIPFEVTCVGLAHVALDVNSQVTICPLVSVLDVNVLLFVPTFDPFTFHW